MKMSRNSRSISKCFLSVYMFFFVVVVFSPFTACLLTACLLSLNRFSMKCAVLCCVLVVLVVYLCTYNQASCVNNTFSIIRGN